MLKRVGRFLLSLPNLLNYHTVGRLFRSARRIRREHLLNASDLKPIALPANRLLRRATLIATVVLVITSLVPDHGQFDTGYALNFSEATFNDFYEFNDIVVDDEGFATKTLPQSGDYDRSELKDKFVHVVAAGENLSLIAQQYGLKKVSTLIWENNLDASGTIKVGQKLIVPPTDGISHKIAKGENLAAIAKKYGVEEELIRKQNNLDQDGALVAGEALFIPEGKRIDPPKPKFIVSPARGTGSGGGGIVKGVPQEDKIFVFPTAGKITQGFHSGHYAHDIANRGSPQIWAAGAGKVVLVETGGWGGGYGNHVIVDHGDGVQTLYAHMSSVYVKQGQILDQGQVLGRMGNSGRVYGPTGIHLHFEVRVNGVKKNPWLYY